MSVSTEDRNRLAGILAMRRCRELDHIPNVPARPCNRCVAWVQRRVEELERAGVIRTDEDRANAAAIAEARRRLKVYRWRTVVAIRVVAAVALLVVVRKARRRWPAR